ncbi:transcription-repair coupling factor [Psychromonas sp. SP041]|uniref:transcription-repair coupling factor n=1 Tax=Psychromonas sp. SP041 TaxID=1365007 RepID=UPI001484ECBF|nr:transcription-repair coupling factor [Psychromonas sp. SP041]
MEGFHGSSLGLAISEIFSEQNKTTLIICDSNAHADNIYKEIIFFSDFSQERVVLIPDTETLPYDNESPHSELISERALAFHKLSNVDKPLLVIASLSNVLRKTSSKAHWANQFIISVGDTTSTEIIRERLNYLGYKEDPRELSDFGQFSIRNSIVDIYPMGSKHPVRVRLENDCVKRIDSIFLSTQLSSDNHFDTVTVLPAHEMPVNDDSRDHFRLKFRRTFKKALGNYYYESVLSGELPLGIEYFLPLFGEVESVFDYMPQDSVIIKTGDLTKSLKNSINYINHRYEDLSGDPSRNLVRPEQLWLTESDFEENVAAAAKVITLKEGGKKLLAVPNGIGRQETISQTVSMLTEKLGSLNKIVFCLSSQIRENQLEIISEMSFGSISHCKTWKEAIDSKEKVTLVYGDIDSGFTLLKNKIVLVTEKELFGQAIFAKKEEEDDAISYNQIQDLKSLKIGDPLVHIKSGVGRYDGLVAMPVQGVNREYMRIKYAESASIFVPMDELDMVSRYGGMSTENIPLDKSGTPKWKKGLEKAVENIKTTAKSLIEFKHSQKLIYGVQFKKPGFEYHKLCKEFPFTETRDQRKAVDDIITDMTSPHPMNRTIVGDVGFGKTEVAMRAAFIAASQGYQVAIMVPTTLLANQHYENFKERMSSFDFEIDCLSIYSTAKAEKEAVKRIASGQTKIVIGTQRLVQKDIQFDNIGLVVIDEEHRFGVNDKKKLREMSIKLDTLTLTATPIPRTLSMSLYGVRDISIIATPPAKRLSIRTIVSKESEKTTQEAVYRELMRDGQVFILHNSVKTIAQRASEIQEMFPDKKVEFAHGRMKDDQMEKIMAKFYRHDFDVLVCTTIIETGIDVKNANTIIIEDADRFGVSQLHQLRGRVGRSTRQAYAYLMHKPAVSDSATKRLKALETATKLGDGFVLASHDLEIRGAGELLGEDQSGHIQSIGFALYMRLLNKALDMIEHGEEINELYDSASDVKIDLNISSLIDDNYIENEQARLSMYKRFASVTQVSELIAIQDEIIDRFGEMPETTKNIIDVSKVRCYFKKIGIKKLSMSNSEGVIILREDTALSRDKLEKLVESNPGYTSDGKNKLMFKSKTNGRDERFRFVLGFIEMVTA